jgi:hypothetical protein
MVLSLINSLDTIVFAMLKFYIPIFMGLLIGVAVPPRKFWRLMDKVIYIMLLIACVSLFFWLFGTVLNFVKPTGTVNFQWDEVRKAKSYYGIYYEPVWQVTSMFNIESVRNCGVFAEAPMYGFLLCMAYSFYRMKEKQKKWIIAIFIITVLSTTGTTAIVYLLIFEVIIVGLKGNSGSFMKMVYFMLFLLILLVGGTVAYNLVADKLSSGSGMVRLDHLNVSLKLFKSTFPLGCGIGNISVFTQMEKYKQGMSIGLPYMFAQGGLGAVILAVFPLGKLLITSMKANKWKLTAFTVAFIWTSVCTVVQFNSPIWWFIVCYAARGAESFYVSGNVRGQKK